MPLLGCDFKSYSMPLLESLYVFPLIGKNYLVQQKSNRP